MGEPMALNLARHHPGLAVWNRTPDKAQALRAAGAQVMPDPASLFACSGIVILMLATEAAMDEVLARGTPGFAERVKGRIVVHMGTTTPAYSARLGAAIRGAGGRYVEAPVSGSRKPAQEAQLVAMTAGDADAVEAVRPLLLAMCREAFHCGEVPAALQMKLAVNLYLITTVAGLTEAFHMAQRGGLDVNLLRTILDSGPMASSVSRMKLEKLVAGDFAVQASIADVLKNNRLVAGEARRLGVATPMLDTSHALFARTLELGHPGLDMIGVLKAIEERTAALEKP